MDVTPQAESSETIRTADGLIVTAYGQTDIGCKRSVNQDTLGNRVGQFAAGREQHGLLYAVADGMGGHAHGEVASAIAIDTIFARYYAAEGADGIPRALDSALRAANTAVYEAGLAAGGGPMGTTLTSVVLRGAVLYVGTIGDSRTYLVRGGRIKQLSQDHSLVGEQLRRGLITEEQARASTIRNVITRAVGHNAQVEPDIFAFTVEAGDRLLLCSDGLHGLVENAELAQIVDKEPLDEGVRTLIALARERGGPDNITALVISIDQLGTMGGTSDSETAPIVIGNSDDTPRVLPRLDDVEMLEAVGSASDEQPTAPIPPLAVPARAVPPAHPDGAAIAAPATPKPANPPAPPTTKGAPRAPVWIFVIVPLAIVALLVAGSFFFIGARRGERQETGQPVGAPAAISTASVALPTAAPSVTVPPTATSAPTTTPGAGGGQLPALASTPTATKEGGFVSPAIPPRSLASPSSIASAAAGQTVIVGTVAIDPGVAIPTDFPDRWMVTFYDQAEWERDQRTAAPRATARLERPLGQNTPAGRYTFRVPLTPPPTGGNYVVQLHHEDGTSVATTADGVLLLAVGASDRVQEFSFRVTGFGGGAEIGR
jgi:serine/threonine protein phosphatase PrpC